MVAVAELVERTRSELYGGSADSLSVLDVDYTPGQSSIKLRYPFPAIQAGQLLSVGLATFYVLRVGTGGTDIQVLPGADDGVDRPATAGTMARLNARYTTAAIFREWNAGLRRLSSPTNGVYGYGSFQAPANPVSGVYFLPDAWGDKRPIRLLVARYLRLGTTAWQPIAGDWQLDQNAVRIYGEQPIGTTLEFVFSFPFLEATALTDTAEALGLNEWTEEIPGLFACARLGRGTETRRNRLDAQGDPRRADEVQAGANLGASRDWLADAMQRTREEAGRLLSQFGYQVIPMRDGTPASGSFV